MNLRAIEHNITHSMGCIVEVINTGKSYSSIEKCIEYKFPKWMYKNTNCVPISEHHYKVVLTFRGKNTSSSIITVLQDINSNNNKYYIIGTEGIKVIKGKLPEVQDL